MARFNGYAHRINKVTLSGTMFGGAEEWSTGFYVGNATADAELPTVQLAEDIATAWETFFEHAQSYISNQYKAEIVKISSFGIDGKANSADTVYASLPNNTQGARSEMLPPQCALVATLQGPQSRGLASKGRMYLPGVVIGIGNNGQTDPFNTNLICVNLKTFLNAVNASAETDNVVMLASHGQLTSAGAPKIGGLPAVNHEVISVKIGTVYDTQRRRRNGLSEQYMTNVL